MCGHVVGYLYTGGGRLPYHLHGSLPLLCTLIPGNTLDLLYSELVIFYFGHSNSVSIM